VNRRLRAWQEAGLLSDLDRHFAVYLCRLAGEGDEEVALMAALASRAVQNGHVCLDVAGIAALEATLTKATLPKTTLPKATEALPPLSPFETLIEKLGKRPQSTSSVPVPGSWVRCRM
jgi:hypothetical protein